MDSEIATEEILKVLTSEEDVVLELEAKIAQQGLDKGVITAGKKKQLIGEIIEQRVDAMDASSIVLTTIIDDQGNREEATTSFEVGSVRLVVTPQRQLQPGIYTLELLITNPITQKTQTITQNFEW